MIDDVLHKHYCMVPKRHPAIVELVCETTSGTIRQVQMEVFRKRPDQRSPARGERVASMHHHDGTARTALEIMSVQPQGQLGKSRCRLRTVCREQLLLRIGELLYCARHPLLGRMAHNLRWSRAARSEAI